MTGGDGMVELRGKELRSHPMGHEGILASLREVAKAIREGRLNEDVMSWTGHKLVDAGSPSGNLTRAKALFDAFKKQYAYMHDQRGVERIAGAHLTLGNGKEKKPRFPGGDCFAEGTLLLTEDHELVPIEQVPLGKRIWGLNGWTRILSKTARGELSVDVVTMNNGSQLHLTSGHHMNVLFCPKHPYPTKEGERACSCSPEQRVMETVRVRQLQPGMVLPQPDRLPFGSDTSISPEQSYVEGLYLADGWCEEDRFSISGKDGCPKEAQKREVQAICEKIGLKTYWHEKHLRVYSPEWTSRLAQMGSKAPEKHLLSINLAEQQVAETLRGILADSGKNSHGQGRTLTTTSRLLAVQARLLLKMQGITCGWSYLEDHGGLGKNPIWRVNTRGKGDKQPKLLRVRSVEEQVFDAPCYDIQTEDGMVYLPEHDVTVHNCDDAVVAYGSSCESAGIPCAVVGAGYDVDRNISHVLLLVSDGNGKWVYADPSAKSYDFGQYKTATREIIIDVLSGEVLCDDTMCSPRMAGRVLNDDAAGSHFLSLNGVETFELEAGPQPPSSLGTLESVGDVSDLNADDIEYLGSWVKALDDTGNSLIKSVEVANSVIKELAGLGVTLPMLGADNNPIFGPEEFQRARNLDQMIMIAQSAFQEVIDGTRKIGLVNGVFGADLVLEALPSDSLLVGYDVKLRRPELYKQSTGERVNMQASNLGAFPILGVAIAAAIATVAISGAVIADAVASAQKAQAAAQQAAAQAEYDLVKAGRSAELVKVMEARKKLVAEQAKVTPGGQVNQAAQGLAKVMETLGWIAVGGGVIWGVSKIAKSLK